jgi:hypothetical protein
MLIGFNEGLTNYDEKHLREGESLGISLEFLRNSPQHESAQTTWNFSSSPQFFS